MVWGTSFGDEVPQSARLSAGEGVQKLFGQGPNAFGMNCNGASLTMGCQELCAENHQTTQKLEKLKHKLLKTLKRYDLSRVVPCES